MFEAIKQKMKLWSAFRTVRTLEKKVGDRWSEEGGEAGLTRRRYDGYDVYLEHQRSKLDFILARRPKWMKKYEQTLAPALTQRLQALPFELNGKKALCLGARLGAEVRAFLAAGCFAVGIDLNPGKNNPYVLYGDFHHLPFPDRSADIVYTNAFDHVYKIDEWMAEVRRVLAKDGLLIVEAVDGSQKRESVGFYEALWWKDTKDVAELFRKYHFTVAHQTPITFPFPGTCFCLRAEAV